MGTMRLVVDAPGEGALAEVDVERLGELLGDSRNRLWLDIGDPGAAEVALLHRMFGFHELALDEVTRPHERTGARRTAATTSSWSTPRRAPATRSWRGS